MGLEVFLMHAPRGIQELSEQFDLFVARSQALRQQMMAQDGVGAMEYESWSIARKHEWLICQEELRGDMGINSLSDLVMSWQRGDYFNDLCPQLGIPDLYYILGEDYTLVFGRLVPAWQSCLRRAREMQDTLSSAADLGQDNPLGKDDLQFMAETLDTVIRTFEYVMERRDPANYYLEWVA